MANSKITDLPEAPSAATDDVLVIVDVSSDETKKIKTETLKTSLAITKADVGLSNVDNTSDLDKPISTAVQSALDLKYDASNPSGFITLAEVPADAVSSVNTKVGAVVLDKSDIGLSEVDNTSDADKPISTATQLALDSKYDSSNPAGYITLTEVPPDAVTSVGGKVGDVVLDKFDVALDQVDNTSDLDKPISTANQTALNLKANSTDVYTKTESDTNFEPKNSNIQTHIANTLNPHNVTKSQIGLSNVDNTNDLDKPISTATQIALNSKEDSSNKGALNGYAPLVDGLVPAIHLPSYVDQVVEVADYASLPNPGEGSVIYITLDDHKTYRWSGSTYIEVSPSDVSSVNGHTGIVVLTKSDIGLSNVDNTSDADKPVSTATQIALNDKVNKGGDNLGGPLSWQETLQAGSVSQTYVTEIKAQELKLESYWNNGNPPREVRLTSYAIYATTDGNPSVPLLDSELVNKKFVDDNLATKYDASNPAGYITLAEVPADAVQSVAGKVGVVTLVKADVGLSSVDNTSDADKPISTATQTALDGKSDTNHTHPDATTSVAGFLSAADKAKLDNLSGKVIGPAQLLSFSNTLFQNSGYVPGITVNSTPSDYGFYAVQNLNFIFNPFLMFGPNKNYRIRAIRRQTGAFNDGTHCMIRQVPENSLELGIAGLLDFGSGNNEYSVAVSDILTSQSFSTNIWYRVYFAAYNGGNGATVQDVTLYFEEVL